MTLVSRLVDQFSMGEYHLCMARVEFTDGCIVTLESFCGRWCFGRLTHRSVYEIRLQEPEARICESCLAVLRQR